MLFFQSYHAELHQYKHHIELFNQLTQKLIAVYQQDDTTRVKKMTETINQRYNNLNTRWVAVMVKRFDTNKILVVLFLLLFFVPILLELSHYHIFSIHMLLLLVLSSLPFPCLFFLNYYYLSSFVPHFHLLMSSPSLSAPCGLLLLLISLS
jgi:hypothetical protein